MMRTYFSRGKDFKHFPPQLKSYTGDDNGPGATELGALISSTDSAMNSGAETQEVYDGAF